MWWKVKEGWREGEVEDKKLSLKIFKVQFIMTLCITLKDGKGGRNRWVEKRKYRRPEERMEEKKRRAAGEKVNFHTKPQFIFSDISFFWWKMNYGWMDGWMEFVENRMMNLKILKSELIHS